MSRESYWDYMGRKMREGRVEPINPLEEKVKELENRVVTLENQIGKMRSFQKKNPWKPNPFDG